MDKQQKQLLVGGLVLAGIWYYFKAKSPGALPGVDTQGLTASMVMRAQQANADAASVGLTF